MIFPKKYEGAEVLRHIFPVMQREVQKVIDTSAQIDGIKRVIVFGSAVTLNCGIGSDLDIAVDAPDIQGEDDFLRLVRPLRRALSVDSDILHYNEIQNELLLHEIDSKGVDVYVKGI